MSSETKPVLDRRICVAPMMDYTDRHCRYFMRLLSPGALLYTEMITAMALRHGDAGRLLDFDAFEQPVALQLGGSEPDELANAARLGEQWGYQEINLNCGCPSDRVKSGRFGACLMGEAERVRDGVAAMMAAVKIPVTVKCRIGIEPGMNDLGDVEFLQRFIATVAESGCTTFIIHARRAVLDGLSPKENREIPPLRYEVAAHMCALFPQLEFVVNGGIRNSAEVKTHLQQFAGVMIGREAYQTPWLLAELQRDVIDPGYVLPERAAVVLAYAAYVVQQQARGERVAGVLRHMLGLYNGLPRARAWRRFLSENAGHTKNPAQLLEESLRIVESQAA